MSAERLGELYDSVIELLLEVGYERLTMDAVAARARTSKMTLYRQWDGKPGLVTAALRHAHVARVDRPVYGSLDEAFEAMSARKGKSSESATGLGFMLLHAASNDPKLAAILREDLINPAVESLRAIFEDAADRGEIVRDSDRFDLLARSIIEHFVLRGLLDDQGDTPARRRAFFAGVIRPALTFNRTAAD